MARCRKCKRIVAGLTHQCKDGKKYKVAKGVESDGLVEFAASAVIGAVTESTILGGLLGGSIVGAMLGDMLDGDLSD